MANDDARISQDQDSEFEQTLSAAKAGCDRALQQIVKDCEPYLLAIANQEINPRIRSKVSPSDIVQETLFSMHSELNHFQGTTRDELLAWLRGIVHNDLKELRRRFRTAKRMVSKEVSADHLARRYSHHQDIFSSSDLTPSTQSVLREQASILRTAILSLSPDAREVIRLRSWEFLSFEEIGIHMNRSADAARKLWSRSILQLKTALSKDEYHD